MTKGKTIDVETGEIVQRAMPLEEILRVIRTGIGEITMSDEEVQEQMLKRSLMATSLKELLSPPEVVPAKQMLNRTFLLKSMRLNNSDFEEGPSVYAIFEANDGERDIMISCGSVSVMEKAAIAQDRGWLPAEVKIIQSTKKTAGGFLPLDLVLGDGVEVPF